MDLRRCWGCWVLLVGWAVRSSVVGGEAILPGIQPDGSVLLPNQWSLRPVGRQLDAGDFPINLAVHPAGRFVAAIHAGWGGHEIRIYDTQDTKATTAFSSAALEEGGYGLVWSPDGKKLYASGGALECIHVFDFSSGYLSEHRTFSLRPVKDRGIPAGLTISPDGRDLYIVESWGQRVEKVDTVAGRITWTRQLAPPEGKQFAQPDEPRTEAGVDPLSPFPYTAILDPKAPRLFVSLWARSIVLVLDTRNGSELARWPVGSHPNEMVLGRDGRLFVAESNRNSVSVLETQSGKVLETLVGSLFPSAQPGSMPNSLTLSRTGTELYIANANNNDIAAFDVTTPGKAISRGFIPVGWFPTSVRLSSNGEKLFVANGKGFASAANPLGPFPGDERPKNLVQYIGTMLHGTVSVIDLPRPEQRLATFGTWSKQAYAASPATASDAPRNAIPDNPIPDQLGRATPIKHVIYVVRENRTYDQILGDMPEGNGAPQLCLFPENVTPNAHELAREFVLLDNFYADGEVSADGHEWTMAAYASDFVEKGWPLNYGHNASKKYDYPSEGRYPIAYPENGYLWNRAAEARVSYRTYGEFTHDGKGTPNQPARPSLPVLRGHVDELYPSWDTAIFDSVRAERFIQELRRFERAGDMPALQVVQLPGDHTEGAKEGARTPTAMVAENDFALGKIVEVVSHSKYWPTTVIFVLEDDAQNGPDHVDAHRMPVLVISPWTKRKFTDSTLYSTTSALRTIELILGLQPMSQFDAAALPMWASFQPLPSLAPFNVRAPEVDLQAKNTKLAWGAKASRKMDFSAPDRVDDLVLNEVIWRSVRGPDSRMPAPVRAAFFKARPKSAGDGDDNDR